MRRLLRVAVGVVAACLATLAAAGDYPLVRPGVALQLPADGGAHPAFRTEWWYVTGWLRTRDGRPLGFQVTFFRTRPTLVEGNPSAFASGQVLIAHAALSDPARGHLLHDQRVARTGFGLAEAAVGRTDVHLRDWALRATARAATARRDRPRRRPATTTACPGSP